MHGSFLSGEGGDRTTDSAPHENNDNHLIDNPMTQNNCILRTHTKNFSFMFLTIIKFI